jgi:hypothetical protein
MSKYRFKTQDEFIRDGQWNDEYDCPVGWNESGDMNHYLGEDVPIYLYERCDVNEDFTMDSWYFEPNNYVLKEEDYTGRWIKAIVDNPNSTSVKLGEVIQIIGKPAGYRLDKTSKGYSGMGISCPLDTSKWELVDEPKDIVKPSSFPSSGAVLVLECDDLKEFKKYLFDSGRTCNEAVGNPKYLSWNGTSFWYPTTGTGKTIYQWNQLKHFIPVSKVVPGYVRCVQALMHAKVGTVYPVVDEKHCLCEDGNTYVWHTSEFTIATKQEYDAQFLNEQDPLYICKQEYRKGMRVKSACKTGTFSGEFIINVEPKEFRNLSGNKDLVDYSFSKGYLYYNGEYAEILEESDMLSWEVKPISELVSVTEMDRINYNSGIDDYLRDSGFKDSNPEAYNWLMDKPSIESVQSVDVKLRTKKQINKHLKF